MDLQEFFRSKENVNNDKKWTITEVNMLDNYDIEKFSTYITRNFYISSYQCPHCGEALYKTVFAPGSEYTIQTRFKNISLKRAFTCTVCQSFIAAIPGHKLSEGFVCSVKYDNKSEYIDKLNDMTEKGTTEGRHDL